MIMMDISEVKRTLIDKYQECLQYDNETLSEFQEALIRVLGKAYAKEYDAQKHQHFGVAPDILHPELEMLCETLREVADYDIITISDDEIKSKIFVDSQYWLENDNFDDSTKNYWERKAKL